MLEVFSAGEEVVGDSSLPTWSRKLEGAEKGDLLCFNIKYEISNTTFSFYTIHASQSIIK